MRYLPIELTKNTLLLFLFAILIAGCAPERQRESEKKAEEAMEEKPSHESWSENATIYEVNIRQYSPEGSFTAFTKEMPRLEKMGVKILWIMPINPIGEVNRKGGEGSYYSVKDYKAINPEFGTLDDFKALVRTAHSLDMKVIVDWVANHSAFDNVWTEDHLDWYNVDSLGKQQPPAGTDWYDVADLNYENKEMRAAMIDAMLYWIEECDIDGYRCDVADMVPSDFWTACRDSLEAAKSDVFMLAEADNPDLYPAFDMTYAFGFLHIMEGIAKGEKPLSEIDDYMAQEKERFDPNAYRMYFTTSHDENSWNGTVFERFGDEGHKTFAVLAFTIGGMPMVYSGQEAGLDIALKFFEKDEIKWRDYPLAEFYGALLNLNRSNEALWNGAAAGDFNRLATDAQQQVYAFVRTKGDHQVVTICNLSDKSVEVRFSDLPSGNFSSLFDDEKLDLIAKDGLGMAPWGYHVFTK